MSVEIYRMILYNNKTINGIIKIKKNNIVFYNLRIRLVPKCFICHLKRYFKYFKLDTLR